MIFEKIRFKNLLSYGNVWTEIGLNAELSTLIIGKNGEGKSTLLDALSFVLFNKPFRNINKPQLVSSINKKSLEVQVSFTTNNKNYMVVRGIKPTKFELYENGILMTEDADSRDYQELLEKHILKFNHKTFCQVIVLGSASYVPFMSLPAAARREVIEDLLDLQIFGTMNTLLKDRVGATEAIISQKMVNKRLLQQKHDLIKKHLEEIQNSHEKVIEEKLSRIQETDVELIDLKNGQFQIAQEIQNFPEIDEVKFLKKKNKHYKLLLELQNREIVVRSEHDFFNDHDNCPTCNQAIETGFKAEQISSKNEKLKEIRDAITILEQKMEEFSGEEDEINDLKKKKESLRREHTYFTMKIDTLQKYKNELTKEMTQLQDKKEAPDGSLFEIVKGIDGLDEEMRELQDTKKLYAAASFLLKDSGIKAKIIRQYIPVINKLVNKYLAAMDFFVKFELDENFKESIKSRHRDEFSFESFSEGEKVRINLAILFAWRAVANMRNSVNTNLLIMDEILNGSLDATGIEDFMKLIHGMNMNIFVISPHNSEHLYDRFSRVLRAEKKKNFSKLVKVI